MIYALQEQEGNENGQALTEETEQQYKHCYWPGFSPTRAVLVRYYFGQYAIRFLFMDSSGGFGACSANFHAESAAPKALIFQSFFHFSCTPSLQQLNEAQHY